MNERRTPDRQTTHPRAPTPGAAAAPPPAAPTPTTSTDRLQVRNTMASIPSATRALRPSSQHKTIRPRLNAPTSSGRSSYGAAAASPSWDRFVDHMGDKQGRQSVGRGVAHRLHCVVERKARGSLDVSIGAGVSRVPTAVSIRLRASFTTARPAGVSTPPSDLVTTRIAAVRSPPGNCLAAASVRADSLLGGRKSGDRLPASLAPASPMTTPPSKARGHRKGDAIPKHPVVP